MSNRHQRRAESVFRRHMVKQARKGQQESFNRLKATIQGLRCAVHNKPCTIWWERPGVRGCMPLCDDCVPDRQEGDRLLRVIDRRPDAQQETG